MQRNFMKVTLQSAILYSVYCKCTTTELVFFIARSRTNSPLQRYQNNKKVNLVVDFHTTIDPKVVIFSG